MADTKKELNLEELEKAAGGAYQRYFRYIVQSGDTLESVAKHFYMSVDETLRALTISQDRRTSTQDCRLRYRCRAADKITERNKMI